MYQRLETVEAGFGNAHIESRRNDLLSCPPIPAFDPRSVAVEELVWASLGRLITFGVCRCGPSRGASSNGIEMCFVVPSRNFRDDFSRRCHAWGRDVLREVDPEPAGAAGRDRRRASVTGGAHADAARKLPALWR